MLHPDSPAVVPGVHCEHIRHKSMYVMTVDNSRALQFFDPYDSASYWCQETSHAFGPDGRGIWMQHGWGPPSSRPGGRPRAGWHA